MDEIGSPASWLRSISFPRRLDSMTGAACMLEVIVAIGPPTYGRDDVVGLATLTQGRIAHAAGVAELAAVLVSAGDALPGTGPVSWQGG